MTIGNEKVDTQFFHYDILDWRKVCRYKQIIGLSIEKYYVYTLTRPWRCRVGRCWGRRGGGSRCSTRCLATGSPQSQEQTSRTGVDRSMPVERYTTVSEYTLGMYLLQSWCCWELEALNVQHLFPNNCTMFLDRMIQIGGLNYYTRRKVFTLMFLKFSFTAFKAVRV